MFLDHLLPLPAHRTHREFEWLDIPVDKTLDGGQVRVIAHPLSSLGAVVLPGLLLGETPDLALWLLVRAGGQEGVALLF